MENIRNQPLIATAPSTIASMKQRTLENMMSTPGRMLNQVVTYWAPRLHDPLPEGIRRSAGVLDLSEPILQIHYPDSREKLEAARQRLAFDEIFLLQLGLLNQKRSWQSRSGRIFESPEDWLEQAAQRLPFTLTGAQQRAIEDIKSDLASGTPMNRLLQGDVGSGKTIVAALAIAIVALQGAQSALMAPTSILAEQHYKNMLYASGWIKRGPSGVIGNNKADSVETVNLLLEDAAAGSHPIPPASHREALAALIRERQPAVVSFEDWTRLDRIEVGRGAALGRPRVKFTSVAEMLSALATA